jgi:hypothetical protein
MEEQSGQILSQTKKISYRRQLTQTTHQQTDKNGTVPGLHAEFMPKH